jgi:hypothetical protein
MQSHSRHFRALEECSFGRLQRLCVYGFLTNYLSRPSNIISQTFPDPRMKIILYMHLVWSVMRNYSSINQLRQGVQHLGPCGGIWAEQFAIQTVASFLGCHICESRRWCRNSANRQEIMFHVRIIELWLYFPGIVDQSEQTNSKFSCILVSPGNTCGEHQGAFYFEIFCYRIRHLELIFAILFWKADFPVFVLLRTKREHYMLVLFGRDKKPALMQSELPIVCRRLIVQST